jgi:hypothetical protein
MIEAQSTQNTLPYLRVIELFPYQPDLSEAERIEIESSIESNQRLIKNQAFFWTWLGTQLKNIIIHPLVIWGFCMILCGVGLLLSKQIEKQLLMQKQVNQIVLSK